MSDRPPQRPPQIAPRGAARPRPQPMAERPGRAPEQPYVDHRSGVTSLARHLRMGLDLRNLTSVVNTHELALILDTMLGVGLTGDHAQQFQANLQTAAAAVMAAQKEQAEKGAEEAADG